MVAAEVGLDNKKKYPWLLGIEANFSLTSASKIRFDKQYLNQGKFYLKIPISLKK
jgi:hypothetical protein